MKVSVLLKEFEWQTLDILNSELEEILLSKERFKHSS
jgi:hypothetical protein